MLQDSLKKLKGIGEKRAHLFEKMGLYTIDDLLHHRPYQYRDIRMQTPLPDAVPGDYVVVRGRIDQKPQTSYVRKGLSITRAYVVDNKMSRVLCTWFNQPYISKQLEPGQLYLFTGRIAEKGQYLTNPEFDPISQENDDSLPPILPIYRLVPGISQKVMRNLMKLCLEDAAGFLADPLPIKFRLAENLCEYNFALQNIHFPNNMASLELAQKRLAYEELLMFQLALVLVKGNIGRQSARIFVDRDAMNKRIQALPFILTPSQIRVLDDIIGDLNKSTTMNRLIQGDVGSGKTVVAFLAMASVVARDFQCAIMAPTEVLALQHYQNALAFFQNEQVGLLISGIKEKERKQNLEKIRSGEWKIVVGTQALIQRDVEFYNLGLIVTDEQHRFGVTQRAILSQKGLYPHSLVLSATPIPRTLALVLYGDLDISVINDLPAGRKTVKTYLISSGKKENMYQYIKEKVQEGMQAYVICPLVEFADDTDMVSATEIFEQLRDEKLRGCSIALLHGRLKSQEKENILLDFTEGKISVLVSTTVVEVGIDVPNANLMVILNADRFGLSQLHQLRGRIGRGSDQAYCFLVSDLVNSESQKRLDILVQSNDGFYIAQKDLELRGPGQMLGTLQHGMGQFNMALMVKDSVLLERTGNMVKRMLNHHFESKEEKEILQLVKSKFSIVLQNIILN